MFQIPMIHKLLILFFSSSLFFYDNQSQDNFLNYKKSFSSTDTVKQTIPLGGNSWVTVKANNGNEKVTNEGWSNWENTEAVFSTYFKVDKPGTLRIYAVLNVPDGESLIQCSINNISKQVRLSGNENKELFLGTWEISSPDYIKLDMKGIKKTGKRFANVSELHISGSAVDENTKYVKNNEDNYFYWGRRGTFGSYKLRYIGNWK